jgi:hypothetical protein
LHFIIDSLTSPLSRKKESQSCLKQEKTPAAWHFDSESALKFCYAADHSLNCHALVKANRLETKAGVNRAQMAARKKLRT